jgi:hypothetical protein
LLYQFVAMILTTGPQSKKTHKVQSNVNVMNNHLTNY